MHYPRFETVRVRVLASHRGFRLVATNGGLQDSAGTTGRSYPRHIMIRKITFVDRMRSSPWSGSECDARVRPCQSAMVFEVGVQQELFKLDGKNTRQEYRGNSTYLNVFAHG